MIVGVPKEIKPQESRVGLVLSGLKALRDHSHRVLVQTGARLGAGLIHDECMREGAVTNAAEAGALGHELSPLPS